MTDDVCTCRTIALSGWAEVEYLGVISGSYVADRARSIASQAAGATSDATSGVPGHREVSEDRQAVRKRYPHAHACVTCSPDARQPGPGCINCRQTGWDQTPCVDARVPSPLMPAQHGRRSGSR